MAEEFLKPQKPIQDGDDYILPVTSYDQIIMPDGISRWDGNVGGKVKTINGIAPDASGNVKIFNGMTLAELKAAIMSEAVYQ